MAFSRRICVLVCSSDKTFDVFRQVSTSFGKHWSDCPFAMFVGLNSDPKVGYHSMFRPIYSPVMGWRHELISYVEQLPAQFDYVLLFLDDYLLRSPVNNTRLVQLLDDAMNLERDYLALVQVRRPFLSRRMRRFKYLRQPVSIEQIEDTTPYYSSLQVALWERGHLLDMLRMNDGSIWSFEHQVNPSRPHFAISGKPPIDYIHVVEKGSWQAYAPNLFRRLDLSFEPGSRPIRDCSSLVWIGLSMLKFEVVGYLFFSEARIARRWG